MRVFHESLIEAEIRLIEVDSELRGLDKENSTILEKQKAQEFKIADREKHYLGLRAKYQHLREVTQRDINSLSEQEREIVREYKELPSVEALELEIQSVTSRLEMMAEGNPGAIRAYQRREEDIQKTRENLEQYAASLEEMRAHIKEIRERWEPQLDILIRKISRAFAHNFEQIGCAGEVQVNKDEDDFDNWSVQISVRFR
jgi:chromosome segregation ATPase